MENDFLKFYNEIIKVSKMCNVTDEEIVELYAFLKT